MQKGLTHREAVALARETLGDVGTAELSAYIRATFGLEVKPAIVTVLLGTLQERAALDRSGRQALEKIERWKAENPEEAKRLAAAAMRREAARRRKGAQQPPKPGGEPSQTLEADLPS